MLHELLNHQYKAYIRLGYDSLSSNLEPTQRTVPKYRFHSSILGSNMANTRSLRCATGMTEEGFHIKPTNAILHLLAATEEASVDFTIKNIDALSKLVPYQAKVAPAHRNTIWKTRTAPVGSWASWVSWTVPGE